MSAAIACRRLQGYSRCSFPLNTFVAEVLTLPSYSWRGCRQCYVSWGSLYVHDPVLDVIRVSTFIMVISLSTLFWRMEHLYPRNRPRGQRTLSLGTWRWGAGGWWKGGSSDISSKKPEHATAYSHSGRLQSRISAKLRFRIYPKNRKSNDGKDHPLDALPDFTNILLFALQVPASLHAVGPRRPLVFAL